MTSKNDRIDLKTVCRERDRYKVALQAIAATDRTRVAMLGPLAVADCVNIAKQALRITSEGK